jgi:formyl-CoA transferase
LFHCADGFVQIAVGSEGLWRRFCDGFDLDPAADGLATNGDRVANRQRLIGLIEEIFASWKALDLLARLDEIGVPAGKVRAIDEVYAWEQTRSQGLLIDVSHDTLGPLRLAGPPLRFFNQESQEVTRTAHAAPPTLDQHGTAVRRWLAHEAARPAPHHFGLGAD